jgi:hypothetical protein
MGRVAVEQAALAQRLGDEREVELLEIAHAAVHELGASARRSLREVMRLEQQRAVAAARRVDCDAQTRRTAAHDDDVEALAGDHLFVRIVEDANEGAPRHVEIRRLVVPHARTTGCGARPAEATRSERRGARGRANAPAAES